MQYTLHDHVTLENCNQSSRSQWNSKLSKSKHTIVFHSIMNYVNYCAPALLHLDRGTSWLSPCLWPYGHSGCCLIKLQNMSSPELASCQLLNGNTGRILLRYVELKTVLYYWAEMSQCRYVSIGPCKSLIEHSVAKSEVLFTPCWWKETKN